MSGSKNREPADGAQESASEKTEKKEQAAADSGEKPGKSAKSARKEKASRTAASKKTSGKSGRSPKAESGVPRETSLQETQPSQSQAGASAAQPQAQANAAPEPQRQTDQTEAGKKAEQRPQHMGKSVPAAQPQSKTSQVPPRLPHPAPRKADAAPAPTAAAVRPPDILPVIPLRDCVVFPGMVIPLTIGRAKSLAALQEAARTGNALILVAQKNPAVEDPTPIDLFDVGTLGVVVQSMKLSDGTAKILVEGRARVRLISSSSEGGSGSLRGKFIRLPEPRLPPVESEALSRALREAFNSYIRVDRRIPAELAASLNTIADPSRICDTIAANLKIKTDVRQTILEALDVSQRMEQICRLIQSEVEVAQVERQLRSRVRKQMEKSQREYYLNEKMQAIQKELGEQDEFKSELDELAAKLKALPLTKEASDKAARELRKLKMMSPMSPESAIVRNYLDWIADLPWGKQISAEINIEEAKRVLDEDHYGLKKIKERILEYLAVQALAGKVKGPILCFVGPPGVGKTSLGRSIARACGRSFVRLSLGGVRDEAEIRGHRRTYVGAMPGKIIQSFKKAGTSDPVFLLDEVDKMSSDFRGDPAAALLEVLDPEQNSTFCDHYLDLDYDLSKTMFICTANTLEGIPPPLRDRFEIIRLPGYTEAEKNSIARRYLIPKSRDLNGLGELPLTLTKSALDKIINGYTREAGVRSLERVISKLCRKIACRILKGEIDKTQGVQLDAADLKRYLGPRIYRHGEIEQTDQVGLVNGLAWTQMGGEMLVTEATLMPGKGKVTVTGQLGKVMQESAQAAMSYVRSRAATFGIRHKDFENQDLHIHVPEGATPKDGPSAGITMATTIISAYTHIPVRRDVAMTGEITLRGRILPIGGLKEKVMAAHRGGIKTVIIPRENKKDIREIPRRIREDMEIIPADHMDEVLKIALQLKDPEKFIRGVKGEPSSQERRPDSVRTKNARGKMRYLGDKAARRIAAKTSAPAAAAATSSGADKKSSAVRDGGDSAVNKAVTGGAEQASEAAPSIIPQPREKPPAKALSLDSPAPSPSDSVNQKALSGAVSAPASRGGGQKNQKKRKTTAPEAASGSSGAAPADEAVSARASSSAAAAEDVPVYPKDGSDVSPAPSAAAPVLPAAAAAVSDSDGSAKPKKAAPATRKRASASPKKAAQNSQSREETASQRKRPKQQENGKVKAEPPVQKGGDSRKLPATGEKSGGAAGRASKALKKTGRNHGADSADSRGEITAAEMMRSLFGLLDDADASSSDSTSASSSAERPAPSKSSRKTAKTASGKTASADGKSGDSAASGADAVSSHPGSGRRRKPAKK